MTPTVRTVTARLAGAAAAGRVAGATAWRGVRRVYSPRTDGDVVLRNPVARWYADRALHTKLMMLLAVMTVVALSVGGVALYGLSAMRDRAHFIYQTSIDQVQTIADMQKAADEGVRALQTAPEQQVDTLRDADLQTVAQSDEEFKAQLERYTAHAASGDRKLVDTLKSDYKTFAGRRDGELHGMIMAHDTRGFLNEWSASVGQLYDAVVVDLGELQQQGADAAKSAKDAADTAYDGEVALLLVVLLVTIALSGAIVMYLSRLMVSRMKKLKGVIDSLADGDLTAHVEIGAGDEIGAMARALDAATTNMRTAITALAASAGTLGGSSEELSAVSQQISASAEETSTQAQVVSVAVEQVNRSVQTVATASEEMGASIREIAQNAIDAAQVGTRAVEMAGQTNETVAELGRNSDEIGAVVKLISSIAEQTNLLALNATIEAARAGDAGRGFAVVANEVKDLARETARATHEIGQRIEAIQNGTRGAVDEIRQIAEIINKINDYQTTIASAVEEQTATTNEVNRNVGHAAAGTAEIAQNIAGVAAAASTTTRGVTESHRAASDLARMSAQLQDLVGRFRY